MSLAETTVTVGITCYNSQDTVERAIRSVQEQDWAALDIVIVDDCSHDLSWKIVTELARSDSRIRHFQHEENRGVAAARNTIIQVSLGTFVAFLDDDDIAMPNRVSSQVWRILEYERRTSAELVFCYSERFVTDGRSPPVHAQSAIGRCAPEPFGSSVADYILGLPKNEKFNYGLLGSGTMMARRGSLNAVGPFDVQFRRYEESDLAIRAALMGGHFISVDQPLITQHKTRGDDKSGTTPLRYALMLRDKYRDYLDERGLYRASRMFARSHFWGNKKHRLKSRFYRALGYALAPKLIPADLRRRFGGVQ